MNLIQRLEKLGLDQVAGGRRSSSPSAPAVSPQALQLALLHLESSRLVEPPSPPPPSDDNSSPKGLNVIAQLEAASGDVGRASARFPVSQFKTNVVLAHK